MILLEKSSISKEERNRIAARKYYWEHKEKCLEKHKMYIKKIRKENPKAYKKLLEKSNSSHKEASKKLRSEVFAAFGNKCSKCGFSDPRALQIDHINGCGMKEMRKIGSNRPKFYRKVLESISRNEQKYQLLCSNCNWIKRMENISEQGRMQ